MTPPERTEDGHHIVIQGRKWRATDPAIPERDAAVLRRWLMSARRDVGTATRADDADGESAARARVHAAKTALGERGPEWWTQSDAERRARWVEGLRRAATEGFEPRDDPTDGPGTERSDPSEHTDEHTDQHPADPGGSP